MSTFSIPETPAWMEQSLCSQVDPELWWPGVGDSGRVAKAVCARCPVREECLQYALDNDEMHGLWGGLSVLERKALRRDAA